MENNLPNGCIEWLAFRRWQIIYAASLLAVAILAIDNFRLRGHVHQLSVEQVKTGLLLTRAEIKMNHMAELISDLRNGRVD